MKIAVAQIASSASPIQNLDQVGTLTIEARRKGARVIVFPEATAAGFHGRVRDAARRISGGFWVESLGDLARRLSITIVACHFETAEEKLRNVLMVFRPDGTQLRYVKRHLFDAGGYRESDAFESGDEPLLVDFGTLTAAFHICYDIRFPTDFIADSRAGADVHVVCASWNNFEGGHEIWQTLCRARAMDSVSWVVGAGQARHDDVKEPGPYGCGYSTVVRPDGTVLDACGAQPQLMLVDIDRATVEAARENYPLLDQQ